ncbi:50S ribosomal protein L3 N(5)-glutamine methyltransferase [Ereboglobus luteus]|uniref:50S ribosomal protein L3 N(5)-glutamine methyltransferase n=1 Tax=Ereboglobus luteus TaxID=1796921 RepID=A0A2U8E0R9_9BACT|nr:50S ribosomal protein L3 N(5)-glutamine methyltransferase [Ereboglobus luteus]AWI08439.1 50S ribosomal protein L3 N(5)-glutamine methyltransferase [Ereboglobus luteus]
MKQSSRNAQTPPASLPVTSQLATLRDWLAFAEDAYARAGLALGQIATNAHDEALYLLLRTLDWPLDSDASVLDKRIAPAQRTALRAMLRRRVIERVPAAYITREAFLGGNRYYVDERVLIPRSYFLELIPAQLDCWLPQNGKGARRVVDVCTGSGCLAIELAHHFPNARVDAIDLSADALDVAKINVREHRLSRRVKLYRSDVFDAVPAPKSPAEKYDVILSNPPYEPSRICDDLPVEFQKEPRLALDGGRDGLDIIRKLLAQARDRLAPHGIVVIEVGGLRRAMEGAFGALGLHWLHTEDGSDCVCLVQAKHLLTSKSPAI